MRIGLPQLRFLSLLDRHAIHTAQNILTLLLSQRPKLHTILAFLSAIGLRNT